LQVRAVPEEGGPSRGETGSMADFSRCSSVATSEFAVSILCQLPVCSNKI